MNKKSHWFPVGQGSFLAGKSQIRTHILGVLALNPHRDNDLNCFVLIFANKSNLKGTDSEEQFLPKVWNRNWK